jgi:hypothetical protein
LAESYFSRCRQHGWVEKSHLGALTQQRVARLLKCHDYVRVSVRSRERDHVIDLPHSLNNVSQLQSLLVRQRSRGTRMHKLMRFLLVLGGILPIAPRMWTGVRPFVLLAFSVHVKLASARESF